MQEKEIEGGFEVQRTVMLAWSTYNYTTIVFLCCSCLSYALRKPHI